MHLVPDALKKAAVDNLVKPGVRTSSPIRFPFRDMRYAPRAVTYRRAERLLAAASNSRAQTGGASLPDVVVAWRGMF